MEQYNADVIEGSLPKGQVKSLVKDSDVSDWTKIIFDAVYSSPTGRIDGVGVDETLEDAEAEFQYDGFWFGDRSYVTFNINFVEAYVVRNGELGSIGRHPQALPDDELQSLKRYLGLQEVRQ